jgi:outer membrane lipoprotein-sorting protein
MSETSERSLLVRHPAVRWAVPVLVLLVVVGIGSASRILTADAAPSLPPRTAAQLLVDLQTAEVAGLSGTVVQKSDLGLPKLPTTGSSDSSNFTSMLTGSHTLRVWYSGKDKQRVALLGSLSESDVVRNGSDVWAWSSAAKTATHTKIPADAKPTPGPSSTLTPQQAADEALAKISPTTKVSTDGTAQVAGRSAYELVLAPKDSGSRIGQVRLAIDSEEKVPLRVRVYARGASTPAFEVGFTQISFTQPDASQFKFTAPPGVKVTEQSADMAKKPNAGSIHTVGSGWTTVVVASTKNDAGKSGQFGRLLESFPKVSGPWGSGRLIRSDLICALITDDGRVIAGAVDPERLYRVAAQ